MLARASRIQAKREHRRPSHGRLRLRDTGVLPLDDEAWGPMPLYRLYRLNEDNRILDRVDLDTLNDGAAISEAIRLDHAAYIEIWNDSRMVSRVAPDSGKVEPG